MAHAGQGDWHLDRMHIAGLGSEQLHQARACHQTGDTNKHERSDRHCRLNAMFPIEEFRVEFPAFELHPNTGRRPYRRG